MQLTVAQFAKRVSHDRFAQLEARRTGRDISQRHSIASSSRGAHRPPQQATPRTRQPMKARFAELGYAAFASSPAEFGKFIVQETEKWAKVIKFAGIKPG
jgi:hypothetical protein